MSKKIDIDIISDKKLSRIVEDSLREIFGDELDAPEQSKQKKMAKQLKGLPKGGKASEILDIEKEQDDDEEDENIFQTDKGQKDKNPKGIKQTIDIPDHNEVADTLVDDIISKLNSIRAGKSLKNQDIAKNFQVYFKNLSAGENQSLHVFLTGLAQVLSGASGKEAAEPKEYGIEIDPIKKQNHAADQEKSATATPEEEKEIETQKGTPNVPIVVGEQANVDDIKKLLDENWKTPFAKR